jgi:ElaB/YqjD/DUF883 family membrane-anchored ribosome-binding protein
LVKTFALLFATLFLSPHFNDITSYQLIKRMPPKRKRTDDKNQFSATATATNDYDDDDIRSLLISLNEKVQEMKNEQKEIREEFKEMKQAFVHRSETKEEFKEMRERMNAIKDTVERIDSVVSPSPLWKFVTDHPDVFEKHVLLSGYLNGSDINVLWIMQSES